MDVCTLRFSSGAIQYAFELDHGCYPSAPMSGDFFQIGMQEFTETIERRKRDE